MTAPLAAIDLHKAGGSLTATPQPFEAVLAQLQHDTVGLDQAYHLPHLISALRGDMCCAYQIHLSRDPESIPSQAGSGPE